MTLPIKPPFAPMEATSREKLPEGSEWQYEPKWDGFRCLAFRDGDEVDLQSKSEQKLARYFPEVVEHLLAIKAAQFVIDGEIVIDRGGALSFDDLLQRIHPAESRIRKLAKETPAKLIVFDLLVDDRGHSLVEKTLEERRPLLDQFAARFFDDKFVVLSPYTRDTKKAREWLRGGAGALDGVVAKRVDLPYQSGNRDGMVKVKNLRTADCVIGGFRYGAKEREVGSLLLGMYGEDGLLHHVGFCSGLKAAEKPELTARLEKLIEKPGFTGRAPGGPSRWSTERSAEWEPLRPELVVEVQYDHFSGGRFRHGTRLLRWRPDKSPKQCLLKDVKVSGTRPEMAS
jgi:ATP-dependent DNA ligase